MRRMSVCPFAQWLSDVSKSYTGVAQVFETAVSHVACLGMVSAPPLAKCKHGFGCHF